MYSVRVLISVITVASLSTFSWGQTVTDRVRLRVEGDVATIFDGFIRHPTQGGNITTPSGGEHKCDGTNNGANPNPSATATSILKDAGLSFDGQWSPTFDDFFITEIGGVRQDSSRFWGVLQNLQFTPAGGCQTAAPSGSRTLWAYDAFNARGFLRLKRSDGPGVNAPGDSVGLQVLDQNLNPVSGATIREYDVATGQPSDGGSSWTTDNDGNAAVSSNTPGKVFYKAYQDGAIRSRRLAIKYSRRS